MESLKTQYKDKKKGNEEYQNALMKFSQQFQDDRSALFLFVQKQKKSTDQKPSEADSKKAEELTKGYNDLLDATSVELGETFS